MNPDENEVWLRAATAALTGFCMNERIHQEASKLALGAAAALYADVFLNEWRKRQLPAVSE